MWHKASRFFYIYVFIMNVCVHMHMPAFTGGGQRTTFGSWFSFSHVGIELGSSTLAANTLTHRAIWMVPSPLIFALVGSVFFRAPIASLDAGQSLRLGVRAKPWRPDLACGSALNSRDFSAVGKPRIFVTTWWVATVPAPCLVLDIGS